MPPKRQNDKQARNSNVKIINFSSTRSTLPPDVEIEILNKVYLLHSAVLRLCSGFFDKSLSPTWWKTQNTHDGPDGIRFRYRLVLDKKDVATSMVEPVPPCRALDTVNDDGVGDLETQRDPTLFKETEKLAASYHSLFGAFYQRSIPRVRSFPYSTITEENISLREAEYKTRITVLLDLLILSEAYCATPSVAFLIYQHIIFLSMHGQEYVSDHLTSFVNIAIKIRSRYLYNDAYVYLVGCHTPTTSLDGIPDSLQTLIRAEHTRLQALKVQIERQLAGYAVKPPQEFHPDGVEKLKSALLTLGENGNEVEFYAAVEEIEGGWAKLNLKPLVGPLVMKNLKLGGAFYHHLTCARKLKNDEYPWEVKPSYV